MLAINAKIYRNTGAEGSPTFAECPEFENVNVTPRYQEGGGNSRDSRFERSSPTLAGVSITARLKKKASVNVTALINAFSLDQPVELLVLDAGNTVVGAWGLRGWFNILAAGQNQGVSDRLYFDLELKPSDHPTSLIPMRWAQVATGPELQYAVPGGSWAADE